MFDVCDGTASTYGSSEPPIATICDANGVCRTTELVSNANRFFGYNSTRMIIFFGFRFEILTKVSPYNLISILMLLKAMT